MVTCPSEWNDSYTRTRCEHPDTNYSDPLLDAPVTSRDTNITYRNWHCAYCHRDLDAKNAVIWDAQFRCIPKHDVPPLLVLGETFTKYLSFDSSSSQWNLNIGKSDLDSDSGISVFQIPTKDKATGRRMLQQKYKYSCKLNFKPQADEIKIVRFCKTDIISTCSGDWIGTEEERLCEAYTARVCSGHNAYRNHHCLICNNYSVPNECTTPPTLPIPEAGHVPSFSMFLDWKRLKRRVCASTEIYDPLSHVCRKVFI